MPFSLLHAGTALQKLSTGGVLDTIVLPSGVTVSADVRARFAILNREILVTNAVSKNIVVSPNSLATRLLNISAPLTTASVAAGGAGVLTGEYRYLLTFVILQAGVVATESPFSAIAGPVTVSATSINLTSIPTSSTVAVNGRRIYRTTNGGADYFLVTTIQDNSTTTYSDNASDFDLALLPAADDLGNAPGVDASDRLRIVVSWKDRIFGAGTTQPDNLYFSENRKIYAWGAANFLAIKPIGGDAVGVTALVPRRDDLLVGKRRSLWMIRGTSPADFQVIQILEGPGPVSHDACLVVHDVVYYLAEDGVYRVSGTGIESISREQVHPWFTTDTHFNRAAFDTAVARWDPLEDEIQFFLAPAGSSSLTRWVSYDLTRRIWRGPHLTSAASLTPTAATVLDDTNDLQVPAIGSSQGFIYLRDTATNNDDGTAISYDVTLNANPANTPDIDKYWGEPSIISNVEAGGTLTVTPTIGGLDAAPQTSISLDLTLGRQRLRRLGGPGRFVKYRLQNSETSRAVQVFGLEQPYHELGRR